LCQFTGGNYPSITPTPTRCARTGQPHEQAYQARRNRGNSASLHAFTITVGFATAVNELDIQLTNADGPAALKVTRETVDGTPA